MWAFDHLVLRLSLKIESFPAQSEVSILLTALGKRHPGISLLPKYTMGAQALALEGKSSHENSDLSVL